MKKVCHEIANREHHDRLRERPQMKEKSFTPDFWTRGPATSLCLQMVSSQPWPFSMEEEEEEDDDSEQGKEKDKKKEKEDKKRMLLSKS